MAKTSYWSGEAVQSSTRRLELGLLGLGVAVVTFLMAFPLLSLPLHISRGYNEGWNALITARLGHGLYPASDGLITNNYPPLSFYIIAAIEKLTGDYIIAGRLVALASIAAVTIMIHRAVRVMGGSRLPAITAAMIFLLCNLAFFWRYIAMNDPQWLAHALMMGGLLALIRKPSDQLSPRAVAFAALLMLAGGLVKHNLLALPLAATLWLLWLDRRLLFTWLLTGGTALVGALVLLRIGHGPAFIADVFGHSRVYRVDRVSKSLVHVLRMVPLALVSATLLPHIRTDRRIALLLLFAALSIPIGMFQRVGEGVYINAHFEALVALCLTAGLALAKLELSSARTSWLRKNALPLLLTPYLVGGLAAIPHMSRQLRALDSQKTAWAEMIQQVRTIRGPVACEELSVCYWAGKGFELDFFNYGQQIELGRDSAHLHSAILDHRFAAAVLVTDRRPISGKNDEPDPIPELFDRAYTPARHGPDSLVVYMPRS